MREPAARRNRRIERMFWVVLALLLVMVGTAAYWMFVPVALTKVEEPIPILSEDRTADGFPAVTVGDPIVHLLDIDRPTDIDTDSATRFLQCESGNLITLTSFAVDLPPGEYEIVVDSILLPDKVTDADICSLHYRVTFQVNPLRAETAEYASEQFVVLKQRPNGPGPNGPGPNGPT